MEEIKVNLTEVKPTKSTKEIQIFLTKAYNDLAQISTVIFSNPEFKASLSKQEGDEQSNLGRGLNMITSLLPLLITDCWDNCVSILAIWDNTTIEEIENQDFNLTIATLKSAMGVIMGFFH